MGFSGINRHFHNVGGLKSEGEKQTSNGWLKVEKQAWLHSGEF